MSAAASRAIVAKSFAGIESAVVSSRPAPRPGPGEVLVQMRALGVHPLEALIAAGGIPFAKQPPLVLGAVGAGEVVSRGEQFAPGARVAVVGNEMGMMMDGVWADLAAVPERLLVGLPAEVDFEAGACLGIAPPTADLALELAAAPPGGSVLITGASGAVGSAAIQLAAAAGLRPIAASRSAAGCAFASDLGASATIDLAQTDFATAAAELTDGGFDAIIDPVGGAITAGAVKALAPGRVHVVLGYSAGFEAPLFLPDLVMSGSRIQGGSMNVAGPEGLRAAELRCLRAFADRTLRAPIAARFGLEEIEAAFATAADPTRFGRVLLVP